MPPTPQNDFGNQFPAGPPQPQPRPGAIARTFAALKSLAGGGFVLVLIVGAAEFLFAPQFKPSVLFGSFWGHVETQETLAKQQAAVQFARQQAAAAADEQARAAIETETARKQQEVIADTFGFQSFMAQTLDLGCALGSMIPRNATDPDTKNAGETLRSACGASDKIRTNIVGTQARAAREGSALMPRPLPPVAPQPQPATPPQIVAAPPQAPPPGPPYKIYKVVPQDLAAFRPY
jgi:hypothetical protein